MSEEDTIATLRADLDALRSAFEEFKVYALPVIDGHQPPATPLLNTGGPTRPMQMPPAIT